MQEIIDILSQPGIDLEQFVSDQNNIFPNASTYPSFLDENLLSPLRVIKYFPDDPHSNFRVFYYHLLKLSYELVLEEGDVVEFPLNNFKDKVFRNNFQIRFSRQTQEERVLFNDFQFKRLLAQFLAMLDAQQQPEIEAMINRYPIMDIVFIHIFRSLMCTMEIDVEFDSKIDTQTVFGSLCSLLEMGLAKYENCWKFEQSDMFCLDETGTDLYFIFTLEEENPDNAPSETRPYYIVEERVEDKQTNRPKIQQPIDNPYLGNKENLHSRNISSDFGHMYSSGNGSQFEKVQSDIKNDILKLQLSAGKLLSNSRSNSIVDQNPQRKIPSLLNASEKTSFRFDNLDEKKQSFAYDTLGDRNIYSPQNQQNGYKKSGFQKHDNPQSTFSSTAPYFEQKTPDFNFEPYKPSNAYQPSSFQPSSYQPSSYQPYSYQPPSNYTPSYEPNYQQKYPATYPSTYPSSYSPSEYPSKVQYNYDVKIVAPSTQTFKFNKSLSIGDYYKDFTNSFLLPMIREPYQSNVRGLKNRVKGRRQNVYPTAF